MMRRGFTQVLPARGAAPGLLMTGALLLLASGLSSCAPAEPGNQQGGPQQTEVSASSTPSPSTAASSPASSASPSTSPLPVDTDITLLVRSEPGTEALRATLSCVGVHPVASTAIADASAGCRTLAGVDPGFFRDQNVPVQCTMQYGGPETIMLSGTISGTEVWKEFRRDNGCAISEWQRLSGLLDPFLEGR